MNKKKRNKPEKPLRERKKKKPVNEIGSINKTESKKTPAADSCG